MSWVDVVIILCCCISACLGAWRGFTKEVLSLTIWLVAIWLAWQFSWFVEPLLGEWVVAPELKIWAARSAIFISIMATGGLLAWLVREIVKKSVLSGVDRVLGSIFGLGRGVIVVGLMVLLLGISGLDEDPWWQEAALKPYGDLIAEGILFFAEFGGHYIQERNFV
ncbi:MAG: colicin V production CvpA [Rhodospirillaceae bacterium]|nr:colicin V production CvpA [Rhodospirillaceae bacterium]|tara:strand:- start:687 stop:1184 length:498 start_codon:yes stop_codon:yes gene_type:complete